MYDRRALVRRPSSRLADGLVTHVERQQVDLDLAVRQWEGYVEALRTAGWETIEVPLADDCPDSVFVEDTVVMYGDRAVITRPGADERKPETGPVADLLGALGYDIVSIEAPGTLDGGDVLRIGRHFYVGMSARSNADGIAQLRALLAGFGYTVTGVPIRGCLHLKSAVTALADDRVLVQPAWVERGAFADYRIVEVDPAEEHAANVLRIGDTVVSPACFPRTHERIRAAGIHVVTVDVSELQKAEGAVTCCSLVFAHRPR